MSTEVESLTTDSTPVQEPTSEHPTEEHLTAEDVEAQEFLTSEGVESTELAEGGAEVEDPEIAALQQRISQAEHEFQKISALQKQVEEQALFRPAAPAHAPVNPASKQEADGRSVHVAQVDYSATAADVHAHFQSCGTINRVTIAADRFSGHPKGYAYIEFEEESSVANALLLNDTLLKGRQIKVVPKRTNTPGLSRGAARGAFSGGFRGARGVMLPGPPRGRGFGPWRGAPPRIRAARGFYPYF